MAKTALQFARYNSLSVQPLCPYITGYIKKHPETQDLLKKGFVLGVKNRKMQKIALIAAMSENRVIGINNRLPWTLPKDWENFRRVTKGKAYLMGRMSYITEDALISSYRNVILTSKEDLVLSDQCERAGSLEEAFQLLENEKEYFILGGASVYEQTMDKGNYLYLTIVHATVEGDAYFPEINWEKWELVESVRYEADERHAYAFSLNEYIKKA